MVNNIYQTLVNNIYALQFNPNRYINVYLLSNFYTIQNAIPNH